MLHSRDGFVAIARILGCRARLLQMVCGNDDGSVCVCVRVCVMCVCVCVYL